MVGLSSLPRLLRRCYGRRSPAIVVTLLLAPAVGLNVAVANLVAALMFRESPEVFQPERLVVVSGIGYEQFDAFATAAGSLHVAGFAKLLVDEPGAPATPIIRVECGTADYLSTLGIRPFVGRVFAEGDRSNNPQVAVVSHGFWSRQFGGRRDVIGSRVSLRGRAYTVIGVAPAGFTGLDAEPVDVWIPLFPGGESCSALGLGSPSLTTIGRLRDGVSLDQATAELAAFDSQTPRDHRQVQLLATSRRGALRRDRDVLLWLAGGALAVLLVACVNAAALFSITAIRRRRELAIRHCLGATRTRVALLLLTETGAAALLCAAAAWLTVRFGGPIIWRFFPVRAGGGVDPRLWLFAGAFALVGCVLSGLLPALRASGRDFISLLKGDCLSVDARSRSRHLVLVFQVALAFALLVGAGLFWRSVRNLRAAVGYDLEETVAITLDPNRSVYTDDAELAPRREWVYLQLRRNPTVGSVAMTSSTPLGHDTRGFVFAKASPSGDPVQTAINLVSPEYVRTVGATLVRGRDLAAWDHAGSMPVALVSDELARSLWHTTDVVGRCIFLMRRTECTRVTGVVRSMRSRFIGSPLAEVFVPLAQEDLYSLPFTGRTLLTRPARGTRAVEGVRAAVHAAAPDLPAEVSTLSALSDLQTRSWRLGATTFGVVGTLAFGLALVGVYCSLSLLVRQRTPEIGVRVALGASRVQMFRMALSRGMALILAGWVIGTVLAFGLTHLVRGLLFGIETLDLATLGAATAGLFVVGALACIVPSLRAARLDALTALRSE